MVTANHWQWHQPTKSTTLSKRRKAKAKHTARKRDEEGKQEMEKKIAHERIIKARTLFVRLPKSK